MFCFTRGRRQERTNLLLWSAETAPEKVLFHVSRENHLALLSLPHVASLSPYSRMELKDPMYTARSRHQKSKCLPSAEAASGKRMVPRLKGKVCRCDWFSRASFIKGLLPDGNSRAVPSPFCFTRVVDTREPNYLSSTETASETQKRMFPRYGS